MFAKIVLITMAVAVALAQKTISTNVDQSQLDYNDILVLKYAATLENLEATFYNKFVPAFTAAQFVAAGYDSSVYSALQTIQAHENAHATFLNKTLGAVNAVPVCNYTFPAITTPSDLLKYAVIFENVGVSAYDGAANMISNSAYVQIAATIATIEARHAGFLASVYNGSAIPFINMDQANGPVYVAQVIAPFLGNCSYNVAANLPILFTVVPVAGTVSGFVNPSSYQLNQNDIAALNYALYLENLEAAFYAYGLTQFSAADFNAAGYPTGTIDNFNLIAAHEAAHVIALNNTVKSLGGVPTPPCVYNFTGVIGNNIAAFVATAQSLENTGVMAYDGALNTIYNSGIKQVAATIATIEARHAAYLNRLVNNASANANAFVSANNTGYAYDYAASYAEIVAKVTASKLVVSCPTIPAAPTVVRLLSLNNGTSTQGGTTRAINAATGTTGLSSGASTTSASGRASTTSSASAVAVSFFAVAAVFALLF